MQSMKLYYSPTSPYVRKVMICAWELGLTGKLTIERAQVSPVKPNAEYARQSPLMKVPALVLPDGRVLVDSTVICEYLDSLGNGQLFPAGEARWDALRLHAVAHGTMDAAVLARYEQNLRPSALRWGEWSAGQLAKVDSVLDMLETEVPGWRDTFQIGQIAVCCALGFLDFRFGDRPWRATRPKLASWFEQTVERASVRETAPS